MQSGVEHRILYYSHLAGEQHLHGVADISKVARVFTQKMGISGLLAFDGEYFCEYLEGSAAAMQELLARIRTDPRHTHMHVLYEEFGPQPRRFAQWSMAYVVEDDHPLLQIAQLTGQAAVAQLLALQHRFDTV